MLVGNYGVMAQYLQVRIFSNNFLDIPEKTLHQLFHVKFTIVSQANPHIQCFFYNSRGSAGNPTHNRSGLGYRFFVRNGRGGFMISSLIQFLRLDLLKWVNFDILK
jgi:hypothetical protein